MIGNVILGIILIVAFVNTIGTPMWKVLVENQELLGEAIQEQSECGGPCMCDSGEGACHES